MSERCPNCGNVPNPDGSCACSQTYATYGYSEGLKEKNRITLLELENQSLREQLKEAIRKLSYGCASEADFIAFHNRHHDLTEELDSLRSQNKELLADKERLDWLQTLDPESRVWYSVMDEMDIRKACDAAMKKDPQ